jgi:alanyl-tRNA synthetase
VLSEVGEILKSAPEELAGKAKKIVESMRSLEKKLETLRVKETSSGIQTYLSGAKSVGGVKVIAIVCDGVSPGGLRQIADELKAKIGSGIVILGTVSGGGVHLLGGVTDDLVQQGWHAGELIKKTASIVGGSGGGRADFAQAGGKNTDRLKDAIESVPGIIKEQAKKRKNNGQDIGA